MKTDSDRKWLSWWNGLTNSERRELSRYASVMHGVHLANSRTKGFFGGTSSYGEWDGSWDNAVSVLENINEN